MEQNEDKIGPKRGEAEPPLGAESARVGGEGEPKGFPEKLEGTLLPEAAPAILESTSEPLLLADDEGNLIDGNRAFLKLIGYARREFLGRRVSDLVPAEQKHFLEYQRLRGLTEGNCTYEIELLRRDGLRVPVWVRSDSVLLSGGRRIQATFFRDVSGFRQAEQEERRGLTFLRTLLGTIPSPVFHKDAQGRYQGCNPSFLNLFGFPSEDSVRGKTVSELLPASLADRMVSADLELLRRPGETSFECKVSGSDGGERTFAVRKASYEDEPGEIGGFIGVMTEITEYKRLEGELRRALNAAESANRAKSAFLAQMSHELRTPMNAIVGTAELLAETGDPVQGERLSMLREAAGTLMELLGNVLDLSRIESGKFVLVEEPFDPLSVCSQVLSILAPEAEGKGLSFRLDPTGFTGGIFRGDGPRLRQVLMNLTGNAVKYTERGEVVLSLRALSREDGRVALFFAVRDTGIGIEPSQVQRVFDYFSQGEEALTRRFPGAGLGLAIARQIVRAMGGDINLVSRPGEGSTFSFSVTLTPGGTLPTVKETGPRRRRADLPKGLKVLVAEDNPLNRRLLKALLERYSWDLRMAPDGEEALRLFREEPFDLALLDIQMPKVDGYRVAREIREIEVRQGREPMPLVALSAYAMKGDRERCLEAGMDDYLPKPVTPEALRRTLGDALAGSPPVFEEPLYRKLTEGNEEVMSEGAEELLKLLPPLEEGLVSALESGNSEEAARLAHRIKGSVAYFGSRIASEAKALEVLLREGDLDRARARAPRLLALSARLAAQVRRRFSPGDGPRTD